VLGTSASTIGASEQAYRSLAPDGGFPAALRSETLNTLHAVTAFVQQALGTQGPCVTVSTACSSSAKAFAQAERWLRLDLVDAVVVGGVDVLCESVLFGFQALGLVSPLPCQPFAATRQGISVGEAAAFVLLQRGPGALQLIGHGEANDAHHMSSPHPEGAGAAAAMRAALADAGLQPADVDYLNLHGTGTPGNDAAEDQAVRAVFGDRLACSSTKGFTGHTLGAAGGLEAVISILALQQGLAPAGLNLRTPDPALHAHYLREARQQPMRVVASNSFGFGGSNACLVFGGAR